MGPYEQNIYVYSLGAELAAAPNTGVELVCWPKTGAAPGLAPKAGVCEGVPVKGDPKDDPNEGVWLAPKPPEGAELNTNGEGAADGAVRYQINKNYNVVILLFSTNLQVK